MAPKAGDLADLTTVLADGTERKGMLAFIMRRLPKTRVVKARILGCRTSEVSDNWHKEGLTNKMVTLSFALSAGIGAIAGIVIAPMVMMDYQRGAMLALKGFGAAILGGLGSGPGAIVAGLLIGILESLGAGYISSHYKDAIALIVLLAVLFIRPGGLFGSTEVQRLKKF